MSLPRNDARAIARNAGRVHPQIEPNLVEIALKLGRTKRRNRTNSDQVCPKLDIVNKHRPIFPGIISICWTTSLDVRPNSTNIDKFRPKIDQIWLESGQT